MRALVVATAIAIATPAFAQPAAAPPPVAPGSKPRVTLDVHNADVGNVLRLIADVSGENLVFGDEVKGKITLRLKDVPWDEALDVVLLTKGLAAERVDHVIRVDTDDALQAERLAALDAASAQRLRGPLVTRIVPLSYARATDMAELVKPLLSPRGTVRVDARTGSLIIRDVRGSSALRF